MKSLEDVLIHVWRQAMVEGARSVETEEHSYPVKSTARRGCTFPSSVSEVVKVKAVPPAGSEAREVPRCAGLQQAGSE